MKFKVFDNKTGKEADPYEIALHEEWAKCLVYCDMEGFAITEDGNLVLMDECGNVVYCDTERFKVVLEDERQHGEWRECEVKNIFGEKMKAYECSNCEKKNIGDIWIMCKLSFCPHCGADMREGDEK